jgi:hypothetical protein
MFKYISEILSKISQSQRILALVILVLAGVSLVLVPQWFDKKDCQDLSKEVESQGNQILQLNRKIVENDSRYTDEKLKRESEIRDIIFKLTRELQKIKSQSNYYEMESIRVIESYSIKDTFSVKPDGIPRKVPHLDFSNIEHEIECLNNMIDKDKKN